MSSTTQVELPSAEAVFASAARQFLDNLTEEDKASFQVLDNAEDMSMSIEQHIIHLNSRRTSRLLDACSKISQFGKALEPFFKIVDIFISSHPDWAAIVWGAIRMVFQLSAHFAGFFERLAAMFQEMNRKLPNYALRVELIRGRTDQKRWRKTHERLIKSLSLVYVDVLQFCHDACRLFTKKQRGVRYKIAFLWNSSWTPFDERFSKILARMTLHEAEFESQVVDVYSEEMIMHYNAMDLERHENSQHRKMCMNEREIAENRAIDQKLYDLQKWINAPNWTNSFESAQQKRLKGSALWLQEDREYQSWLTQKVPYPTQGSIFAKNVLVIAGKPGYGKTILSTRIIEGLEQRCSRATTGPVQISEASCVAFFYFDQQQADRYSRVTALRSIAAQLLHAQRNSKAFIDIASMMMRDSGQGQLVASEKVLQSLIQIYVSQLDTSYMIFDGLDECAEWDEFLISLRKCTENTRSKIVLLTRPHLSISAIIGQKPFRIDLEEQGNLQDIEAFMRPAILPMAAAGKLGSRYPIEKGGQVVRSLARRADSIFLWAELMLKYLQSPTLTPKEREEIIEGDKVFGGLEKLFAGIINDLQKRVPPSQHAKILKIFEWLVTAQEPWNTKMLETALAVQPDKRSTCEDYIADFEEALLQLCGPLVELRQDKVVRFIHLSVAEYLTSPTDVSTISPLSVQLNLAHCSMTILALSYIINEVPKEPLSGNALSRSDPSVLAKRYCLLRYGATYWSKHASLCWDFSQLDDSHFPNEFAQRGYQDLLSLLLKVFADKRILTMWIEASWTFEAPPTTKELASQMSQAALMIEDLRIGSSIPKSTWKALEPLAEKLKRLSKNLYCLNKDWGHILAADPNEIWLPSTNAFTDSEFWVGTDAASVNWLPLPEEGESILIATQVSSTGKEVGVIKVWPSKPPTPPRDSFSGSFVHYWRPPEKNDIEPQHWVVAYQIWSLDTLKIATNVRFEISPNHILREVTGAGPPDNFRFPVALSPSLHSVFIMGTILQVISHNEVIAYEILQHRCPFNQDYQQLLDQIAIPRYLPDIQAEEATTGHDLPHKACHEWMKSAFSPCGRYATVLRGPGPPSSLTMFSCWVLSIYEKADAKPESRFRLIANSGLRLNSSASQLLCFHPKEPVIAICMMSITVIWQFQKKGAVHMTKIDPRILKSVDDKFITICNSPLDKMRFSDCGNFFFGLKIGHPDKGTPVFLHMASTLSQELILGNAAPGNKIAPTQPIAFGKDTSIASARDRSIMLGEAARVQNSGMPKFSVSRGQLQISSLTQDGDSGSVTLRTMHADGTEVEETLSRIPKSSTLEKSYSSLVPTEDDNSLRLVLNMAIQDSYSVVPSSDFKLPIVLDRKRDSIPIQVYTKQQRIESGSKAGKRYIDEGRNSDSEEAILAKRRR